jgi:hypothetical protein
VQHRGVLGADPSGGGVPQQRPRQLRRPAGGQCGDRGGEPVGGRVTQQHQSGHRPGHDVVPGRGEPRAQADQPGGGAQRGVEVGPADGAAQGGQRATRTGRETGEGEGAVRDALAVEGVAQVAHALGQQGRTGARQPGTRVPPGGGTDGEVADDDPPAPDLGRRVGGQRHERAAVAGPEEHAGQREPRGVAGQHPDDVAPALGGDLQVDGGGDAEQHARRADRPAQEVGDTGARGGGHGGRGTGRGSGARGRLGGLARQGDGG